MSITPLEAFLSTISRPIYGGVAHILMFHRVCQPVQNRIPVGSTLEVSPEFLEEAILFIKKGGFAFVSLDELITSLRSPHPVKNQVVFTFDDGYIDNYTIALPILKGHNIPFTIYIATSFPDRTANLWWYAVDDLIQSHDQLSFTLPSGSVQFDTTSQEGKITAAKFIRKTMKSANPADQSDLLSGIFGKYGMDVSKLVQNMAMSWAQIKEISADPLVTVGAHTVDHFVLNKLDDAELRRQIVDSRSVIESHIGKPVRHFAYPYGSRTEAGSREFNLVKDLGFESAVTSRIGNIFPRHRSFLECLPRLDMPALRQADRLDLALSGFIPARKNRLKRFITD